MHGGKQKERSLKFEQEDEQSRGFNAVKQTDIILKSEKYEAAGTLIIASCDVSRRLGLH